MAARAFHDFAISQAKPGQGDRSPDHTKIKDKDKDEK
jgi:hypothetical protein